MVTRQTDESLSSLYFFSLSTHLSSLVPGVTFPLRARAPSAAPASYHWEPRNALRLRTVAETIRTECVIAWAGASGEFPLQGAAMTAACTRSDRHRAWVARWWRWGVGSSPAADMTALAARMREFLPHGAVLTELSDRRTYECDGLAYYRAVPGLVVIPQTPEQAAAVVGQCAAAGVPFVARGSGTGLSGGALPDVAGVLIVMSQMRQVLEVDVANRQAMVEVGAINLGLTRHVAPQGYYFAPDPSSQQICSIGGNVAENSGGAHCLKYGFTVNHVLAAEVVLADGDVVWLGSRAPDPAGYDLLGAFVGSEGTLGLATRVVVRLLRQPEAVKTLLAAFDSVEDAGAAVSAVISAGIVPAAIEMMDALAIEAAEAAVHCGYPPGARAVLIVELDGPLVEVEAEFEDVRRHCKAQHAFEIRVATDDAQRALFWKGRKSAFAAVGRISPEYFVQDGVIPRTALPEVLARIERLAVEAGVRVANVFHAGDGNLHPLVLFDDQIEGQAQRAEAVSGAILDLCIEYGGSITGEHGVGADKKRYMSRMFTPEDLDTMQRLRCAFDPEGLANPGKVFPTPRLCGERPGRRSGVHPLAASGAAEIF